MSLRAKNEWKTDSASPNSINIQGKPDTNHHDERVLAELFLLRQRLKEEGASDLLAKNAICQKLLVLKCTTCQSRKEVKQRCKKRWCPSCAKALASTRARELDFIVERMRFPLFVTLTMRHGSQAISADVRKIILAFGKFRRRKLWTCRTKGGAASVELTNQDGGWHPHIHAVIDCEWLAWKVQPPARSLPRDKKIAIYKAASIEMGRAWAKQCGQDEASVRIKRANRRTIAKEVTKYTVKNEDLVTCTDSASEMIRAIDKSRTFYTFGEAHGLKVKAIRAQAKAAAAQRLREYRDSQSQYDCCPAPDFLPDAMADNPRFVEKIHQLRCIKGEAEQRELARSGHAVIVGHYQLAELGK